MELLLIAAAAYFLASSMKSKTKSNSSNESAPVSEDYQTGGKYDFGAGSYPFSGAYEPGSSASIALFESALSQAGLPIEWASEESLQALMEKESGGWVGRPNYTFGIASTSDRSLWPQVWAGLKAGEVWTKSTATGLGQLIRSNVKLFYPSGYDGIGVPTEEAVGFVRYIYDRYGDPDTALAMHGSTGEYVNTRTGETVNKTFKEGY